MLDRYIDLDRWLGWLKHDWGWVQAKVLVAATLVQLSVIALILLISLIVGRRLSPWLRGMVETRSWADRPVGHLLLSAIKAVWAFAAALLLGVAMVVAMQAGWPYLILQMAVSLIVAWLVIHLSASIVTSPTWARLIKITAMTVAAMSILTILDDVIDLLDSLAVSLGGVEISVLSMIKGVVILALVLKGAFYASAALERRILKVPDLTPSLQVLLGKVVKVSLFTVAVVITLSSIGIDLTAFAVFSGAVGVGVGFGLQKVVSNLVAGVILLLDKSIKPGDVIELDQTFGRIESMGGRYVAVITRDGTEYLIPNEDLITNRVVNWSYTDRRVRLKIPIGVAYDTDLRQAQELCLQAAASVPRLLKDPTPRCWIVGFGDSSVDLQLRVWIGDPENGVTNVRSQALLAVWDQFKEHGIEIPFPQRDVHLKSGPPA